MQVLTTWDSWAWKTDHLMFSVACGLRQISGYRPLSLWLWKMAWFCMIYWTKICRFIAKSHPKFLSCIIFLCQIAEYLTPISALCCDILLHPSIHKSIKETLILNLLKDGLFFIKGSISLLAFGFHFEINYGRFIFFVFCLPLTTIMIWLTFLTKTTNNPILPLTYTLKK